MRSRPSERGGEAPTVAPTAWVERKSWRALPGDRLGWRVLGIESSCDDTGAAVVRGDGKILGEALASQAGVLQ